MTRSAHSPLRTPIAVVTTVAALALCAFGATASAAADPANPVWVAQSDIQDISATSGWAEDYGSQKGVEAIGTPAGDVSTSLELSMSTAKQQITVQKRFDVPDYIPSSASDNFAKLRSLLSGADYTFKGTNVSYQVNVAYKPVDEAKYGVTGSTPCAAFTAIAGWCYTTLKYVPVTSPTDFTTIDIDKTFDQSQTSDDPKDGIVAQPGWFRSQQIGNLPKAGSPNDNPIEHSLNTMLAQISELQVYSFGVSIGPALGAVDGWVKDLSFGGTTYRFGTAPVAATPAPAPAANTDALDTLLQSKGVDIDAATDSFVPAASTSGPDAVDPTKPFSGDLPWSSADNFVDVYAYSTPIYLGTFPVVNGKVVLTGVDLSALQDGSHTLVFMGQDSGTFSAIGIKVFLLASTGTEPLPWLIGGSIALLLGVLAFVFGRRMSRAHR